MVFRLEPDIEGHRRTEAEPYRRISLFEADELRPMMSGWNHYILEFFIEMNPSLNQIFMFKLFLYNHWTFNLQPM